MKPKTMKLLDPNSGLMQCGGCGAQHFANIAPGGRYRRGSWHCVHGCQPQVKRNAARSRNAQQAPRV